MPFLYTNSLSNIVSFDIPVVFSYPFTYSIPDSITNFGTKLLSEFNPKRESFKSSYVVSNWSPSNAISYFPFIILTDQYSICDSNKRSIYATHTISWNCSNQRTIFTVKLLTFLCTYHRSSVNSPVEYTIGNGVDIVTKYFTKL
jgi:hypothetical protein